MQWSFLLFQVPGVAKKIPGVPIDYIPQQGMEAAVALYEKMYAQSLWLLAFVVLASFGLSILADYWTASDALKQAVLALILLVGMKVIFGGVIAIGATFSEKIIAQEDVKQLNEKFREAAIKAAEDRDGGKDDSFKKWYEILMRVTLTLSPAGALASEIMMTIASILFFASTVIIAILWRVFVIILFVFGPVAIVLGAVPRWGSKITSAWFTAVVQISAWQIWMAICAWFVNTGDAIFQMTYEDKVNFDKSINNIESIGIAFVFSILYLATPFLINALLPISRFSTAAAGGLTLAAAFVTKNAVFAAKNAASLAGAIKR